MQEDTTEIIGTIAHKTKSLAAKLMLSLVSLVACAMLLELSLRFFWLS